MNEWYTGYVSARYDVYERGIMYAVKRYRNPRKWETVEFRKGYKDYLNRIEFKG